MPARRRKCDSPEVEGGLQEPELELEPEPEPEPVRPDQEVMRRLRQLPKIQIPVFGFAQDGKSTLICGLIGSEVAPRGTAPVQ